MRLLWIQARVYNSWCKDIIKCYNDSTVQIKQGHWVGKINDAYTTATCLTQYCGFSSCNEYKGYCQLLCNHDGQCKHHRTGPACGTCKSGFVLPFDSIDCVESSKCSAGITVLLVILIIIYWFVTVTVIIVLINFGYASRCQWSITLAGISIYYNSVRFCKDDSLGSLCFVNSKEWSEVDQQIICYIHPILSF